MISATMIVLNLTQTPVKIDCCRLRYERSRTLGGVTRLAGGKGVAQLTFVQMSAPSVPLNGELSNEPSALKFLSPTMRNAAETKAGSVGYTTIPIRVVILSESRVTAPLNGKLVASPSG